MSKKSPAKLEVRLAVPADVPGILALISRAYPGIENYSAGQVRGQINNFPDGQFVAIFEGTIVGYCASSRIDEAVALAPHDWATITGNGFGSRHDPTGDWLYGVEMAVDERQRGLRIGKRLYEARRALAENMTPDEVRHVGLLALTTIGFPHTVAGLGWIDDVIASKA